MTDQPEPHARMWLILAVWAAFLLTIIGLASAYGIVVSAGCQP